jgi:hypothetical protein
MKRREFIRLAGAAAASVPLAARAQQKLPTIGFLGVSTSTAWRHFVAAFEQRLRELGWIDGRTVTIEYRWAEGRGERFAEISAEFVRLKVDVIVAGGGAVLAAMHATSVIPIVFTLANDPVGAGLVASLSRPRQRHRIVAPGSGDRQQAVGAHARGAPRFASARGDRKSGLSPGGQRAERGSDGGARRGPRACRIGDSARRGIRARYRDAQGP